MDRKSVYISYWWNWREKGGERKLNKIRRKKLNGDWSLTRLQYCHFSHSLHTFFLHTLRWVQRGRERMEERENMSNSLILVVVIHVDSSSIHPFFQITLTLSFDLEWEREREREWKSERVANLLPRFGMRGEIFCLNFFLLFFRRPRIFEYRHFLSLSLQFSIHSK